MQLLTCKAVLLQSSFRALQQLFSPLQLSAQLSLALQQLRILLLQFFLQQAEVAVLLLQSSHLVLRLSDCLPGLFQLLSAASALAVQLLVIPLLLL